MNLLFPSRKSAASGLDHKDIFRLAMGWGLILGTVLICTGTGIPDGSGADDLQKKPAFQLPAGATRYFLIPKGQHKGQHFYNYTTVTVSPDWNLIAQGWITHAKDKAGTILWDVKQDKSLSHKIPGVWSARLICPNNRTLITSALTVWDITTGVKLGQLPVDWKSGAALSLSPDGKTVAACAGTGINTFIQFWDLATYKKIKKPLLQIAEDAVRPTVEFAANGQLLLSFAKNVGKSPNGYPLLRGYLQLRDGESGALLRTFAEETDCEYPKPYLTPDGRFLASVCIEEVEKPRIGRSSKYFFRLWEVSSGKQLACLPESISSLVLSPDGRYLVSRSPNMIWDLATDFKQMKDPHQADWFDWKSFTGNGKVFVTRREIPDPSSYVFWNCYIFWDFPSLVKDFSPVSKPDHKQLKQLWQDLIADDAPKARKAVWQLAAAPELSLSLLKDKLYPMPALDSKTINQLIQMLDSSSYTERQKATAQLKDQLHQAAPAIQQALAKPKSLEQMQRLESLAKLFTAFYAGERLRRLRAIEVLERIGTAEARKVLEHVAGGDPLAPETQDAKAAIQRLKETAP